MANSFDNEIESPEMETLASLAENLVYRLPGCTDIMIRKTLRDVYRDFCRRSCCLRVRRHFRLEPEQEVISCFGDYGGHVDCVSMVEWNHRKLVEGRDYRVSRNGSTSAMVILAQRLVPDELCDERNLPEVTVEIVEVPRMETEEAPVWFIEKYGDAMCSGVLARLMSMTGKAWTDVQQSNSERMTYENFVNEARICFYAHSDTGDTGDSVYFQDMI